MFMLRTNNNLPDVKGQVESQPAIGTDRNNELVITHVGNNEGAVFLV